MLNNNYGLFLATLGSVGLIFLVFFRGHTDPREPKYIHGKIPYLWHAFRLLMDKTTHFVTISKTVRLPIFTIPLPGIKIYVISSPQLVLAAQKIPQDLAFPPIATNFIALISGCSQDALDTISMNMMGEQGDWGYSNAVYKTIRVALMPGSNMNDMVRLMIQRLSRSFDRLAKEAPKTIELTSWLRHEVTMATANAVWGPEHPLRDEKVEEAFWEFEDGLHGIMLGVLPSLTARRSFQARKRCSDAFYDYFANKRHEQGSELVKVRYKTSSDHNISIGDIAKFEILNIIATTVNTYPAVFWMTYYVFSRRELLDQLRKEVDNVVETEELPTGAHKHRIDIAKLRTSCPLLLSCMQETLRLRSVGATFRVVLRDTLLDQRYLLKKGSIVTMPNGIYHSDTEVWGGDALEFDHNRFLHSSRSKATSFRTFGGGHTLCPGRHFAMAEMLSVAAMLLLRFDFAPADGAHEWPPIRPQRTKIWAQLTEVEALTNLDVGVRECWGANDEWIAEFNDDTAAVQMPANGDVH